MSETEGDLDEGLPPFGAQRLPLTPCIPYNFRWRISELKLLLNDLKYLFEKHDIEHAMELYKCVQAELEELCVKLRDFIVAKRNWREELSK